MSFEDSLRDLINRHSEENESNTPDWILRNFIVSALIAFNEWVNARDKWYGINPEPGKDNQD